MKIKAWFTCALILPLFVLAAGLVLPACSSVNKTTYSASATTALTVDAAMSAWGRYVAANHPGVAAETKVKNAFEHYKAAVVVLADAASGYLKSKDASGNATPQAQKEFNAAVAGASAALGDLVALLQSYGVKL